ncbi:17065_t:CDS:2 [Entrophospora sp. SA101]|nr:17058_t:CDS:2 [Entrophospora sp. SA101]CAJ0915400.1 17065_t:CDS:2 [Entrophospora sp. SA101]
MTISCKFEILNKICKSISDHGHNYRPNQTAFSERKSFKLKSTKYGANYSHFIYEYVLIDDSGSTIYEIDLTDKSLNDAKDCLLKNYLKVDITTSNKYGYVNLDIKFLKYKGSTQYIDLWQISETDFLFNLNESPLTKKIKNNEFQVILYNYNDQQARKQVAMADENLFLFRIDYDDFNDRNDEKQPKQIRVSADIVDRKGNILKGFNLLLTKDEIIYLDVIDGVNGDDDKKMVAEEKNNINIYSYKGGGVSITILKRRLYI